MCLREIYTYTGCTETPPHTEAGDIQHCANEYCTSILGRKITRTGSCDGCRLAREHRDRGKTSWNLDPKDFDYDKSGDIGDSQADGNEPTYIPLRGRLLMPRPELTSGPMSLPATPLNSGPDIINRYIRMPDAAFAPEPEAMSSSMLTTDTATTTTQSDVVLSGQGGVWGSAPNRTERGPNDKVPSQSVSSTADQSTFDCEYSGCPWCEHPTCVQITVDCSNCRLHYLTAKHLESCDSKSKFSCLTGRLAVATNTGRFCVACTPDLMESDKCQRCQRVL